MHERTGAVLCGQVYGDARLSTSVCAPAAPEVRSRGAGPSQKEFGERVAVAIPAIAPGKPLEIWFQDEARTGQQGRLTRVWAQRGSRPRAPRDTRYASTFARSLEPVALTRSRFGAVCPGRGTAAGRVLPCVNPAAMNAHLAEIARRVAPGAHAVRVVDGAGWHGSKTLDVPDNIALLPLLPYSPAPDQVRGESGREPRIRSGAGSGPISAPTGAPSASSTTTPPSSMPAASPGTASPTIPRP